MNVTGPVCGLPLPHLRSDPTGGTGGVRRTLAGKGLADLHYQLSAFRLDGRLLVAFGAAANHCAFYPMSAITVEAHKDELKDHDTSKGTIRFRVDNPLPATLVRKLVKARVAENAGRQRRPAVGEVSAAADAGR